MKTKNITNINFLYENGYFLFHSTELHKELLLNEDYQPLKFIEEKTQLIDVTNLPVYLTRIVPLDDSKKNYILEIYKIIIPDFVNHIFHLEKIEESDSQTISQITFDILKSFSKNNKNDFDFDKYKTKYIQLFLYNLLKPSTTENLLKEVSKETLELYNKNIKLMEEIDNLKSSYATVEDLNMTIISFCSNYLPKGIDSFNEEFAKWYSQTTIIN